MATTIDDFDDLVTASESATETSGKYFAIDVPDYEDTIKSGSSDKRSYLRVGAADPNWVNEPGADLIARAYLTGATGRLSASEGDYTLAEADNVVAALGNTVPGATAGDVGDMFIDDQRERGTGNDRAQGAPGHGLSRDERRARSAKLHSDVGWRDHTDGNRITTTRGDKVEVVYGNYKLVVLGRQHSPDFAQGWEANGNHVQDWADGTMPGASVKAEWVPDTTYGQSETKGAWLLENSTERVYQYSRYAGNFREQIWGDLYETYIGSENPEDIGTTDGAGLQGHPTLRDQARDGVSLAPVASSVDLPRGNPVVIERTWATRIDTQQGSEAKRVPRITDKAYADHIESHQDADTVVAGIVSKAIVDYEVAVIIFESRIGAVCTTFFGPRLVMELTASAQITGLLKLEWSLGWRWAFSNLDNEATLQKNELDGIRNRIFMTHNEVGNNALAINRMKTRMLQTDQKLSAMNTQLSNQRTDITQNATHISSICNHIGAMHLLG
ncbi:MAG: hypothetical protein R3B70_16780 [Polyangiaceae bacterium]